MQSIPEAGDRDALRRIRSRAEALALPPAVLPGWSSVCGTEYSLLVVALTAEVTALRAALDAAVLAADP